MAPRKPRAVGEHDQCPMLKLIMEKGPLSGQIFDFGPGSVISIGRVVRGNTLAIKDAGISSKHLLIQAEAAPDTGRRRWTVTDLWSSNGTVLNGDTLEPSDVLSDDDTIKIGEQTSIRVKFEANLGENEGRSNNVRRNARRGVRDLGVIDEVSELGSGNKDDEKKSGVEAKNVGTRRGRNSRKDESVPETGADLSVIEGKRTGTRGRPRKNVPVQTVPEETEKEESCRRSEVEASQSAVAMNSEEKDDAAGMSQMPAETEKEASSRRLEVETNKSAEATNSEEKDAAAAAAAAMGQITEETEKEESNRRSEFETNKSAEAVNSEEKDNAAGMSLPEETEKEEPGRKSEVETNNSAAVVKGKMVVDLQNMSLGQWFDFLEVYLPLQTIDETEEMIVEMRRKAERFHEFMLEQQKAKGHSAVVKC